MNITQSLSYLQNHKFSQLVFAVLVILCLVIMSTLIIDPSLLSASLSNQKIYSSSNNDTFLERVEDYAGVLPNSPLYDVYSELSTEDQANLYLSYAKLLKASSIGNEDMARSLYISFLENLNILNIEDRKSALEYLSSMSYELSLDDAAFEYAYLVSSLIDKEDIWINKLLLYVYDNGSTESSWQNAKLVFEDLAEKPYWELYLQEKGLINNMKEIKKNLMSPLNIEGENFYAVAEENWFSDNPVWSSL